MILSKSADYALRAMVFLARRTEEPHVPVHEIATAMRTPPFLLARILQRLVQAELVVSMKGHHGGFRLRRDPSQISIAAIVAAIDGPFRVFDCDGVTECGLAGDCGLVDVFARAEKALDGVLRSVSLAEVLRHDHTVQTCAVRRFVPIQPAGGA